MKTSRLLMLGLALISTFAFSVNNAFADNVDRVSVGLGYYDVFDDDDTATDFRIEYRPGESIFWELKPWIGVEVTSDGGLYGAAGFLYDFALGNQWVLTPSIGGGLYADGDGKDLGGSIQFRTQLELAYQFENTSRISGSVSHISNAGIKDNNPGTEVLGVYYHIPMDWISGGSASSY